MDFPFGHHHRRDGDDDDRREGFFHHHRRDGDDDDRREGPFHHQPPPQPDQFYPRPPDQYNPAAGYPPPEFPPAAEYGGTHNPFRRHHGDFPPQDPAPPPAPYSSVEHVGHESHTFPRPDSHGPAGGHHFPVGGGGGRRHHLPNGVDSRVFCEADPEYSLTIRNGTVILAPADPNDEFQHWIKDEECSTKVKDEEGYPCFALVNKATGEALKHAVGATKPVLLGPYKPDEFDPSVLWSMSKDFGHGFRTIRMVNNIRLNVDAFKGDKHSGGIHDGTEIVLWEWKKGENQKWKIVPY